LQSQLDCLDLKIKEGMVQDATFTHLNPGHAKEINREKMKQKQGETEVKVDKKRAISHTLDINFIA
jgi:hypothetical protein